MFSCVIQLYSVQGALRYRCVFVTVDDATVKHCVVRWKLPRELQKYRVFSKTPVRCEPIYSILPLSSTFI